MGLITKKLESNISEYVKALDVIQFISSISQDTPSTIAKYLINHKIEYSLNGYTINDCYQIFNSEISQDGVFFETFKVLEKLLNYFVFDEDLSLNSFNYPKLMDIEDVYWKKAEFFELSIIKDLNITEEQFNQFQLEYKPRFDVIGFAEKLHENQGVSAPSYIVKIFNQDSFSIEEASLFIHSNRDEQGKFNFEDKPNIEKIEFISDFISREQLTINKDGKISKDNLKQFLSTIDIRIKGFNEDTESIKSLKLSIENEKLKKEIKELNSQIADLKVQRKEHALVPKSNNLLDLIFDVSAKDRYASDLVLAIKLWLSLYIDNPKNFSHAQKANTWIKNNSPYSNESTVAFKRLREITMPTELWHSERKKNINN